VATVESDLRAPDVLGEVIAWRAWKVIGSDRLPMLSSVTHATTIWHPAHYTFATCGGSSSCRRSVGDLRVPGERCSCGLYAAKTREQLIGLGYGVLIGEVALSGKVIPGTQGWRAEKGRIAKLYVPFTDWKLVSPLEDLYQVPVVLDRTTAITPTKWEV
jgi:hypothetical protein